MLEVLKSGGLLMIPIGFCAVVATFIIFDKIFYFGKIRKKENGFADKITELISSKRFDEVLRLCRRVRTPVAMVVEKAINCRTWSESNIKDAVSAKIDSIVPEIEHLISALGTIANISTLLGLLGTVTGNIQAFGVLGSGTSMGNPALLADSIAQALLTTAAGLAVSIPSVVFHNYFVSKARHKIMEIENLATSVVLSLCGRKITGE